MPPKSGKQRNLVSVEAVVKAFEDDLHTWILQLISKNRLNLWKVHQGTGIISKDLYNKLRDNCDEESIANAILRKVREASEAQVLSLLDIVLKEVECSSLQVDLIRKQLLQKPMVSEVPTTTHRNKAAARKEEMLYQRIDVLVATTKTAITDLEKCTSEKEQYREQAARSDAKVDELAANIVAIREDADRQNSIMKEAMEEMRREKEELQRQLEENASRQAKKNADMERELRAKDEVIAEKTRELASKSRELQATRKQLNKAIRTIHGLETKVEELEAAGRVQQRMNEAIMNRLDQLDSKNSRVENRLLFTPRSSLTEALLSSLPGTVRREGPHSYMPNTATLPPIRSYGQQE